jgi:hypothetical protein
LSGSPNDRRSSLDDLAAVTRGYGFLAPLDHPLSPVRVHVAGGGRDAAPPADRARVVIGIDDRAPRIDGVRWQPHSGGMLRESRPSWLRRLRGAGPRRYFPKLPYAALSGGDLVPIWETEDGHCVIAWSSRGPRPALLVGLDIAGEIVRCRQGDPARAHGDHVKAGYGFDFERPNHLFQHQLVPGLETTPFADVLGFWWVETLAAMSGMPLLEPLPGGARGVVLLTGDDDQADLSRYERQLAVVGSTPITYYLHPLTHHTRDTLAAMPPNVDYGVHVDALEAPAAYADASRKQCHQIRALCGRDARTVRNHGYLNDGYLGHLPAWEADDLRLDVNFPGVDGTALNGSFLPFQVRRVDGTWSSHYSLLTAFGDGMIYALGMTEGSAISKIGRLSRQIERNHPGILVFNLHPQNIIDTEGIHREVVALTRRRGWVGMTAEQLLDWVEAVARIRPELTDQGVRLIGEDGADRAVLRYPGAVGWSKRRLASCADGRVWPA